MTILDIENTQIQENLSKINDKFKKDIDNLKSFQQELKDEYNKIVKQEENKKEIKCN